MRKVSREEEKVSPEEEESREAKAEAEVPFSHKAKVAPATNQELTAAMQGSKPHLPVGAISSHNRIYKLTSDLLWRAFYERIECDMYERLYWAYSNERLLNRRPIAIYRDKFRSSCIVR